LRIRRLALTLVAAATLPAAACGEPALAPAKQVPPPAPATPIAAAATSETPASIRYRVVESLPHDPNAFTQGLVFDRGRLYESTGQYGESSLREVELATGRVLRREVLSRDEFGEGLALAGDRLVQITWRNGLAHAWDAATFRKLGTMPFEGEGWGLAFDGNEFVQSDGSDRLTFRDSLTFAAKRTIAVKRGGTPQFYLNELEWIEGAIWANVWMSDEIVRIDPATGAVTGALEASNLLSATERVRADVLNGIAWDPVKRHLLVTGKYWPRLFVLALE
jgi:glutamine cyclotransferase